ncbi:hypothetical protein FH972_023867 [Carpinus fangiana]|uniref:BTB domain-containing protein n=1 Tax=Carpinus fangiana TaxID=176857 RepID=A0A5N6KWF9_9ROSI|nr:hypothetical protein FH972_023867 [Carpinus fangiana]
MTERPSKKMRTDARFSPFQSKTVILSVGPAGARFTVHRDFLYMASPYFLERLDSGYLSHDIMILPEAESPTIENFLNWLYSRRIEDSSTSLSLSFLEIEKLWVFAYNYRITTLMDKTVNAWHERFSDHLESSLRSCSIEWNSLYVYENTEKDSKLRKLRVEILAHLTPDHKWDTEDGNVAAEPEQLRRDLLYRKSHAQYRLPHPGARKGRLKSLNLCQFHEHGSGEPCSTK